MADKALRTTPAMAVEIADNLGMAESITGNMFRRIREEGYGSQSGRGTSAAMATSQDAAVLLLVCMATDRPVHAGVIAEVLTALKLYEGDPDDLPPKTVNGLRVKSRDLIGVVTEIIDAQRAGKGGPNWKVHLRVSFPLRFHILWEGGSWNFKPPDDRKGLERYDRIEQRGVITIYDGSREVGLKRFTEVPMWVLENIADWLEGRESE